MNYYELFKILAHLSWGTALLLLLIFHPPIFSALNQPKKHKKTFVATCVMISIPWCFVVAMLIATYLKK